MNGNLFARLDRLLLEFVFQCQQDTSTKEEIIQRINKCLEDIKESKETICKIQEGINKTDEEITHYCKHNEDIKDKCINWKPTYDVFHKHEDYMQGQYTIYQETIEKDKKTYHGYVSQFKDVLKHYQLKYSEMPLSRDYYEKKREYEEIRSRVSACTEQLKTNETILTQLTVPAPFPSLSKWTLHIVNLRFKTKDILKHVNNFTKKSSELKTEINEAEIEINYLNKIARLYQSKNLSETLEENNKNTRKRKKLKERIFEKDEHAFSKTLQGSQLYLPYESPKLVRPIKMQSSEPEVTDDEEEIFMKQSKLSRTDFRQKENVEDVCAEPSGKVEGMTMNFPRTPEIPSFLRTEAMTAAESLEKVQLPKTPLFEINRITVPEGQSQTESSGFSFLMSYSSRSPGLNLFDSSVFDSETSSEQPGEHHRSAVNFNPPLSQEIGNLFGKRREDVFTFSFPSDTSTRTFGTRKDD
ncbi:protein SIX6OS1, partial [Octodon degus]|uniref:Protein SIX6OS1 n=1 Tax=Octodon degus TaxID=10160 RepID=A0A6P6DBT5_OCTDE